MADAINTASFTECQRIMLILNPVAGRGQSARCLPEVTRTIESYGHEVSVFITEKAGDATRFVIEYGADFCMVVCLGGDGTFNEVITGIVQAGGLLPVGYIPAGSANDFARTHRLPADATLAVREMLRATGKQVDIGRLNERFFSYVAAFGAFTSVSYATSQPLKNAFGHVAYMLRAVRDASKIKTEHVRILYDTGVCEGDYLFGAICNTLALGGLLSFPEAHVSMNDGIFEVLLIRMPDTVVQWTLLLHALANQDYACKDIEFFHSSSLIIETEAPMEWTLDGEYAREGPIVRVENLHRFLTLAANE